MHSLLRSPLFALGGFSLVASAQAQTFTVLATEPVISTGLRASPGQQFAFTTVGSVNLAIFDSAGPGYITDSEGTILTAPTPGGGSYEFFTGQPVNGVRPVVGGKKYIANYGTRYAPKIGGVYGGLYAGFASSASPLSYTEFTSGFALIGKSGSITAPASGGYLFFTVNDIYGFANRSDNSGGFQVTAVPEPGLFVLLIGIVPGVLLLRRRRK